jgi:hypothetical protein
MPAISGLPLFIDPKYFEKLTFLKRSAKLGFFFAFFDESLCFGSLQTNFANLWLILSVVFYELHLKLF